MSPVLEEVGRVIFTNNSLTVNLLPALLAIAALGLCEYILLTQEAAG